MEKQADNILGILKKDAEQTYANIYEEMLNERFDGTTINEKRIKV